MINLLPAIKKLEQLKYRTTGQSAASVLSELADFLQHDLTPLIDELNDAQVQAEAERDEYELEIEQLDKKLEWNWKREKEIQEEAEAV